MSLRVPPRVESLKKCMGSYPVDYDTSESTNIYATPSVGCTAPRDSEEMSLGPNRFRFSLPPPLNTLALLGRLNGSTTGGISENRVAAMSILFCLITFIIISHARSSKKKLPPQPRRTPIIGNLSQMTDKKWLFSRECKEEFGEYRELIRRTLTHEHHDHHQARSCISMSWEDLSSSSTV